MQRVRKSRFFPAASDADRQSTTFREQKRADSCPLLPDYDEVCQTVARNMRKGALSRMEEQKPDRVEPEDDEAVTPEVDSVQEAEGTSNGAKATDGSVRFRQIRSIFDYVETFCIALSVMIVLFLFVFRYVSVDGDSMLPTLHGGKSSDHADRLIISDFFYTPQTGDIVVIQVDAHSEKPLIKRVIATGGQTVRMDFTTWQVWVDGVLLDESYINYVPEQYMNPADMDAMYGIDSEGICEFTVAEGKVFVMGDNRNDSRDSRFLSVGEQDVGHILGKVIIRLFPFSEFGSV